MRNKEDVVPIIDCKGIKSESFREAFIYLPRLDL